MTLLTDFHPAVAQWFQASFAAPTAAQSAAWPAIQSGRDTLVAAPTGSGKTLTAFLATLDALVRQGLEPGGLPDRTVVVYVSPLKALSNDIRLNLELPLAGIRAQLRALDLPDVDIRTAVRTGDTPPRERQRALRKPPHILVTTPESLYVLLGSVSGRAMLAHVRHVIVDEIHALAADKRGSHLALSLERLQSLVGNQLVRIGLSATQKPIDEVARFLVGAAGIVGGRAQCEIVDIGYGKQRDLALELPAEPLGAVLSNAQWAQVYARVVELVSAHRTTLVFVNTRRMAERAARHLGELLGKDRVAAHHGSLAKEARLDAEQRLKRGALKVLVATASLELGLDIGDVDLVCQLGSPRSIATFLQRAGRSGHAVGGVPKARLFPQSRDELVECVALLDCIRRGELDALRVLPAPLDVLAQQLVAETACREWEEDALYALVRRAWPYAALQREDYDAVLRMLTEGFATRQGQRASLVHRDAIHHRLRERKGSRMTALTSGGTIPETGDYAVLLEPQDLKIGSVNEDFAVESLAGDVFQLGNASYRILRIEPGRVRVTDAQGAAPNIPFWLGEAPGRSDELSAAVSRLRSQIEQGLATEGAGRTVEWAVAELQLGVAAARQLVTYLERTRAVLGALPTQQRIVIERFFDESGGMQLVLHSPFGSRLNRAWGLALRKRFCRKFNFELQAAATEDAIVLSLSTSHSFPLDEVLRYLHSASALHVLTQALLDAPLFGVRWRWNATTALALPRFAGGRKVAPQLQRMRSEDLLAAVFPDQVACAENLVGEREVPEHPLVAQTLYDCLYEAMDAAGWLHLLQRLESGAVAFLARDLPAPSPLAAEALCARPYAYLDDAPIEERRTQAVQRRAYTDSAAADELGRLDPQAIESVRLEAWPQPRNSDEMHEALLGLGLLTEAEVAAAGPLWLGWLQSLATAGRATCLVAPGAVGGKPGLWVAAERASQMAMLYPHRAMAPMLRVPQAQLVAAAEALTGLLRSRLGGLGPVRAAELADSLQLPLPDITTALRALQGEGSVLEGHYAATALGADGARGDTEWCERHLLARIHRYTLKHLRREIEPVAPRDFARFLFDWQHVAGASRLRGRDALTAILEQLEAYEAPAALWESELLPARLGDYVSHWLDDACTSGRTLWSRLRPLAEGGQSSAGASLRTTPIVLLPRRCAPLWAGMAPLPPDDAQLHVRSRAVVDVLARNGASFSDELAAGTRLLQTQLEEALADLVMRGRVHCDSFAGLRALLVPAAKRGGRSVRGRRRMPLYTVADAGRWTLVRALASAPCVPDHAGVEHAARTLLQRYGVVCWALLKREAAWLPAWRDLVHVYRRLEARGEIRGGRFIAGVSGEQFALPAAIVALRALRQRPADTEFLCLAAADPANLLGSVVAGVGLPRVAGARVVWRDGVPVATAMAAQVQWLVALEPSEQQQVTRLLTGASGHGVKATETRKAAALP